MREKSFLNLEKDEQREYLLLGKKFLHDIMKINYHLKSDNGFSTSHEEREEIMHNFTQKRIELFCIYIQEFSKVFGRYSRELISSLSDNLQDDEA